MDIINIYCVLVKPGYNIKWVERLHSLCKKYLSYDFTFTCLTDQENISNFPIEFIQVEKYELDTWWNKVLIFKNDISKEGINLYFDLDINFKNNIDFLIKDPNDDLYVIDTVWKNERYFELNKGLDAFTSYGNSSVMLWKGNNFNYLCEMLLSYPFKHTIDHYGDDTFINMWGNCKYLDRRIIPHNFSNSSTHLIHDPIIFINYKDIS
jgi:hypothetical protein